MALNATALGDNIATVFERGITEDGITSVKIALDFAAAYKTYASNAEDGTGDSPATVNEQQFDLAFADGFPVADSSEPIARLIADAAAAYWTGATFQIINPPQGADTEISALVPLPRNS